MEYNNYIVKVGMTKEELASFSKILPLVSISLSSAEQNLVSRLLGYNNRKDLFENGYDMNPFLQNAYSVLSFLYISRADHATFNDFWKRLVFTDKDVEVKVRRTFNIPDEGEMLSHTELEAMWLLDCDTDKPDFPKQEL